MQFVPFTEEYLRDIIALEKECFGKNRWKKKAIVKYLLNDDHVLSEVLIDNDKVVGYYYVYGTGNYVDIGNIGIFSQYRRQGYGSAIMERITTGCRNIDVKLAQLFVRESNTIAQHLYEKYGFKKVDTIWGYYKDNHEDAYVMEWTNGEK